MALVAFSGRDAVPPLPDFLRFGAANVNRYQSARVVHLAGRRPHNAELEYDFRAWPTEVLRKDDQPTVTHRLPVYGHPFAHHGARSRLFGAEFAWIGLHRRPG